MPRRPNNTEIDQFIACTNCNNRNFVVNHLQKHNNNINNAVDAYFSEGHSSKYSTNESGIKEIFNKYKGKALKLLTF